MFCFSLTAANKRRRIFKVGACGRGYFKIGAPPFLLHPFNSSSFFFLFSNPLLSKHKINPQLCVCVYGCTFLFCLFSVGGKKKKEWNVTVLKCGKVYNLLYPPPFFFLPHWRHFVLFSFFPRPDLSWRSQWHHHEEPRRVLTRFAPSPLFLFLSKK